MNLPAKKRSLCSRLFLLTIASLVIAPGYVPRVGVGFHRGPGSLEKQRTEAADVVEMVGTSGVIQRLQGVIVDVTGKGVVLQGLDGSSREIPCEKVIRIETRYSASYHESQRLLREGHINEAISLLEKARAEESRAWVRREMTAQIVRLLQASERYGDAAREFLTADFASDSGSPYWACIPLVWFPEMSLASETQNAAAWMRATSPVAQLLGASFLLDGPHGAEAVAVLKRLQLVPQREIALMAVTQLWRREVQTADKATIEQWEKLSEDLPKLLRPGPCYLIATAWRAQGDMERAMLAYLKPPILWPENRRIAARCLWEAASLWAKHQADAGEIPPQSRADVLYQELAKAYPESPWARQVPTPKTTN